MPHALACLSLLVLVLPAAAQRGTTARVSVSSDGLQAIGDSIVSSISADGRFVVFQSTATNLVLGDTNLAFDIFVHDTATAQTTRVSVSSAGQEANDLSYNASISADGRFVAFVSRADNLVPNDTNVADDIFVHDRATGQTSRVSVSSAGQEGNHHSFGASISADGRFVAFWSRASNLVSSDSNDNWDVFVHDRPTGQTTRVSVSSTGQEGNDNSAGPSISADGRFVAFHSGADNLVPGDKNEWDDVFLHDRATGQTTRVSVSSAGEEATDYSYSPSVSADGRFVAFDSHAGNLVPGDTNGLLDVFVHDRANGQTTRLSVSSTGEQADLGGGEANISADGRFVAFESLASNLVSGDTNSSYDVFVRDRATGQTTRVSVSSDGQQGNETSWLPSISADGRFVAFESAASDLVFGDTNASFDVFVHQYGPDLVPVAPQSFTLFRGVLVSGALSHLLVSDDNRMVLRPGVVLSQAEAPIQLVVEGTAPSGTTEHLRFKLEAHTNIPNIRQRIAFFDFAANQWEQLDSRLATTSDSVADVVVTTTPDRFIERGTNRLRARVSYKEAGPVFSYPWFARIDQTVWMIAQ